MASSCGKPDHPEWQHDCAVYERVLRIYANETADEWTSQLLRDALEAIESLMQQIQDQQAMPDPSWKQWIPTQDRIKRYLEQ